MKHYQIGQEVHQVVFGYQWIAKVVDIWQYGYKVQIDDRHKEQFDKWGQDLIQFPFFSGVYK